MINKILDYIGIENSERLDELSDMYMLTTLKIAQIHGRNMYNSEINGSLKEAQEFYFNEIVNWFKENKFPAKLK